MAEHVSFAAARNIPEPGTAIGAGGQRERAVETEGDHDNPLVVVEGAIEEASRSDIPQPRDTVLTRGQETGSSAIKGDVVNPVRMAQGLRQESCCRRIQQEGRVVALAVATVRPSGLKTTAVTIAEWVARSASEPAARVPELNLAFLAAHRFGAGRRRAAVGAEDYLAHGRVMLQRQAHAFVAGAGAKLQGPFGIAGQNGRSIGTERQRGHRMPVKCRRAEALTRLNVPEPRDAVDTAGEQQLAIGAERSRLDRGGVRQRTNGKGAVEIDELGQAILTDRRQGPPVTAQGRREERPGRDRDPAGRGTGPHTPDLDLSIFGGRQNRLVAAAECDGRDRLRARARSPAGVRRRRPTA